MASNGREGRVGFARGKCHETVEKGLMEVKGSTMTENDFVSATPIIAGKKLMTANGGERERPN